MVLAVPSFNIFSRRLAVTVALVIAGGLAALAPAAADAATCDTGATGGISLSANNCKPIKKARLVNGKAIAPASAPAKVKQVIEAANRIRTKRYIYGGGHGLSKKLDRGYDCSGSVSYALRAAGFITSPMPSGSFINWKNRGAGRWITTYANGGHMYMVVAGLRFDTSAMRGNGNNRWTKEMRSSGGFSVRHPGNY
ncbi:MAG: hypothetical protein M9938_10465 [Solirubrobacterales bacterium]|nr:hypothetical protein [Solirubrobacterales bacterium]